MSLTDVLILVFGGLAAGVINTMAGGGSTITVPLLVFAGVPGTYANGSNRVGILPASLAAVFSFRRLGVSGFRDSRIIFLPVIIGSTYILTVLFLISIFIADLLYGYFDPRVRTSS